MRARTRGADFCTSGENVHMMGRWSPEGVPSLAAWAHLYDSTAVASLHLCARISSRCWGNRPQKVLMSASFGVRPTKT